VKNVCLFVVLLVSTYTSLSFATVQNQEQPKAKLDDAWKEALPIGAKIKILRDLRPGGSATGKIAEYTGGNEIIWKFLDEKPASRTLPEGYVAWDPETQPWQGEKVAIPVAFPVFRILGERSTISGADCSLKILDEALNKRAERIVMGAVDQFMQQVEKAYLAWREEEAKWELYVTLKHDVEQLQIEIKNGIAHVGISSVDALNRKYGVYAVEKLFVVTDEESEWEKRTEKVLGNVFVLKMSKDKDTDMSQVTIDYANDPHVESAHR